MPEALMIVLIMVVFFGSIVGYVYGGIWYENYKDERDYKRRLKAREEKEKAIKSEMEARQAERDEKYQAARERSNFIKKELKRIELLKQGVVMEEE